MFASHRAVLIFWKCVRLMPLASWFVLVLPCAPSAWAQHVSWAYEARFDGPLHREDQATAITADPFGNAYVTGGACVQLLGGSCNNSEMVTIKYDPAGHAVWVREFRNSASAGGAAIAIDAAENVYVAGFETVQPFHPEGGAIIIKYGPTGNVIWSTRDSDVVSPLKIAVDASGDVYIGGEALLHTLPNPFSFVAKYSPQGSRLWLNKVTGSSNESGFDGFGIDAEGNAYLAQTPHIPAGGLPVDTATITYKFDATSGSKLWSSVYNPPEFAIAPKFALSPDGDVYLSGFTNNDGKIFALRYNTDGQLQWATTTSWPSGNIVTPTAIALDPAGNAYVSASDENRGAPGPDFTGFVTTKYSGTGALLWQAHYQVLNGPNAGFLQGLPLAMAASPQGDIYIGAIVAAEDSPSDYLTVKYDTNGQQIWSERFNGPGPNHNDQLFALALGGGSVFVTGTSEGASTGFDYLTIRYVQDAAQICVSHLAFAAQKVGTVSAPQTFTITNASKILLEFKGIAASGDFIAKNDCPLMLSPGLSCNVSVTFSPKASGLRTGILTVSDDGVGSPQFVKLTGTGVQ